MSGRALVEEDAPAEVVPPDGTDAPDSYETAAALKASGNEVLALGHYDKAAELYVTAIKTLVEHPQAYGRSEANDLERALYLNLALCHLKSERYFQAVRACEAVLMSEPQHVKALMRCAEARVALGDYANAADDLSAAEQGENAPSALIAKLRHEIARRQATSKLTEKKRTKKMVLALHGWSQEDSGGERRVAASPGEALASSLPAVSENQLDLAAAAAAGAAQREARIRERQERITANLQPSVGTTNEDERVATFVDRALSATKKLEAQRKKLTAIRARAQRSALLESKRLELGAGALGELEDEWQGMRDAR